MIDESAIRQRFEALFPVLDERGLRRFAAAEAKAAGHGGVSAVMRVTGLARSTIGRGLRELRGERTIVGERVRRPGGGRKSLIETDASLLDDLRSLVEPDARGDPQSPLLWTSKSLRKLAESLREMGHRIGRTLVGDLLHKLDYSLQGNRKTREGSNHPDRDAQFCYINDRVKEALASNEPAISVDTKKKELVGDFKNAGREWRQKGSPEEVRVHDFLIPELGRAVPYGVYDIARDAGWVSVGVDHDTAAFAVNVDADGPRAISERKEPAPHRRRRRLQRFTRALVESRTTKARQRTRPFHHGVSPAAGHKQMGQDRASSVFVHHHQLARPTACQPSSDRSTDRSDHHQDWP